MFVRNLHVSDSVGASSVQKPKRRAYLIKRKAITTSIFDTNRGKDDKEKGNFKTLLFVIKCTSIFKWLQQF